MREGNINRPRNLSDLVIEKYTVDSQLMILLQPWFRTFTVRETFLHLPIPYSR